MKSTSFELLSARVLDDTEEKQQNVVKSGANFCKPRAVSMSFANKYNVFGTFIDGFRVLYDPFQPTGEWLYLL